MVEDGGAQEDGDDSGPSIPTLAEFLQQETEEQRALREHNARSKDLMELRASQQRWEVYHSQQAWRPQHQQQLDQQQNNQQHRQQQPPEAWQLQQDWLARASWSSQQ